MTNFQITQGTGTIIATDTGGGGENYQKIKLIDATLSSTSPTGVAANPLQVSLANTGANATAITVDGSGVTQPISGTVTANQGGIWNVTNITGTISLPTGAATETTLTAIKTDTDKLTFVASRLLVDGSGVTQPVSGTITANAGTGNFTVVQSVGANLHVDVDNFPAKQTVAISQSGTDNNVSITNFPATQPVSGTVTAQIEDSSGGSLTSTGGSLNVNITGGASSGAVPDGTSFVYGITNETPVGGVYQDASPALTGGKTGALRLTQFRGLHTNLRDSSGNELLGQQVSADSIPVVIASNQSAVPVSGTVAATQSGSWTVSLTSESIEIGTVDQGTPNTIANAWPVLPTDGTNSQSFTASGEAKVTVNTALPAGTNVIGHVITDSGSTTAVTGTVAATQSGTWNINNVSGTVSLPTGASTSANQTNGNQKTQIVDGSGNVISSTSNSLNVNVTNTEPISGTVTSNQGTPNTLANAWPVELSDGTNLLGTSAHPVRIDPTGTTTQPVSLASTTITGTVAVTQSTSPWVVSGTVTANIGTTNGLALDTSVNGILVSQGSTTSGEKGPLIQGAVTTSSPSYTTAQTSPLSLTTSGALRTDSSATTQPISAISLPLPTGASTSANQTNGSQQTQIVQGGNTAIVDAAGDLQVDINNFPATQTVAGTVTSNQGAAAALAGAWPVEITDGTNILGTSSHPVRIDPTGTTTQPVSGTVTANAGTGTFNIQANASVNVTQINGNSVVTGGANGLLAVSGPVASGSTNADNPLKTGSVFNTTQPTVTNGQIVDNQATARGAQIVATGVDTFNVTVNTALPAGTNVIGHVITDSGSTTAVTGNVTVVQSTAANLNATVVGPTLTKGTQGATGFSVQNLKDAGRTYVTFTSDAVAGVTSETLLTMTQNRQGSTSSASTYTPTSGKTLRIQSITVGVQSGAGAGEWVRVKFRHNTAGATTTSSALVYTVACGTPQNQAATGGQVTAPIPDGLEIFGDGTQTIGFSHISSATTNVESITICGYEY